MDVVDDQIQKGEDPLNVSGSKYESQKPRSSQINLILPSRDTSAPIQPPQPPASPTQLRSTSGPLYPLINARDSQGTPFGSPNEMGLTTDITTSNILHKNVYSPWQNSGADKEWKVFVRKKRGCHKRAQQMDTQPTRRKAQMLDADSPTKDTEASVPRCLKDDKPTNHYKFSHSGDMPEILKKANEEDTEEALSQWKLAKIMGVNSESDQASIINRITEMENRDNKEAAEMGKSHSPS